MIGNERGYALIEALLVGLILIVPLIWVLTAAASLHRSALASASAVREAGLAASRAATATEATTHARSALGRALSERGLDPSRARVQLSWRNPLGRAGAVEVKLETAVDVIRIPFVGRPMGPVIWVRARHVAHVEPYRSLE